MQTLQQCNPHPKLIGHGRGWHGCKTWRRACWKRSGFQSGAHSTTPRSTLSPLKEPMKDKQGFVEGPEKPARWPREQKSKQVMPPVSSESLLPPVQAANCGEGLTRQDSPCKVQWASSSSPYALGAASTLLVWKIASKVLDITSFCSSPPTWTASWSSSTSWSQSESETSMMATSDSPPLMWPCTLEAAARCRARFAPDTSDKLDSLARLAPGGSRRSADHVMSSNCPRISGQWRCKMLSNPS